jgi:hypothetical protein
MVRKPRIRIKGPIQKARTFIKEGLRQLSILRTDMGFTGREQGQKITTIDEETSIVVSSVFGIDEIFIETVPLIILPVR